MCALLGCLAAPAVADTWPPPEVEAYASENLQFRFTVVPRELGSDGLGPQGTLERNVGVGQWRVVWQEPLVNRVSPVSALVADSGSHVITFDNWHGLGHGDDVVVVYGAQGGVLASLGLEDLLPESFVQTLPRSFSSIHWGGKHRFSREGDEVLLEVAMPGRPRFQESDDYFHIRLNLATGKSTIVRDQAWFRAQSASRRAASEQARQRADFEDPLSAPDLDSRAAWRTFSREVFFRLAPDWPPGRHETLLLRLPPDRDYMTDVRSIRGMLGFSRLPPRRWPEARRREASAMVFASPATAVLADALVAEAARLPVGVLAGWRVYVVCESRDAGRLRLALARLGADPVLIDPGQPIPQRPERLQKS